MVGFRKPGLNAVISKMLSFTDETTLKISVKIITLFVFSIKLTCNIKEIIILARSANQNENSKICAKKTSKFKIEIHKIEIHSKTKLKSF